MVYCNSYTDLDGIRQKKCMCRPNYELVAKSYTVNGCGNTAFGKQNSVANTFISKPMISCCNVHDVCINTTADSGVCANDIGNCFNKIQKYSPMEVFIRKFVMHSVTYGGRNFVNNNNEYFKCVPRNVVIRGCSLQEFSTIDKWSTFNLYHENRKRNQQKN